jgi:hypothetical protein
MRQRSAFRVPVEFVSSTPLSLMLLLLTSRGSVALANDRVDVVHSVLFNSDPCICPEASAGIRGSSRWL